MNSQQKKCESVEFTVGVTYTLDLFVTLELFVSCHCPTIIQEDYLKVSHSRIRGRSIRSLCVRTFITQAAVRMMVFD